MKQNNELRTMRGRNQCCNMHVVFSTVGMRTTPSRIPMIWLKQHLSWRKVRPGSSRLRLEPCLRWGFKFFFILKIFKTTLGCSWNLAHDRQIEIGSLLSWTDFKLKFQTRHSSQNINLTHTRPWLCSQHYLNVYYQSEELPSNEQVCYQYSRVGGGKPMGLQYGKTSEIQVLFPFFYFL